MMRLFRYRALVVNLVAKDIKLKYRDSVLGVAWSLLNPLLLLGVYTLTFRYVMRVPMENYPCFLLVGLLPWNFFAGALQASTLSIADNGPLIRKVPFPLEALPLAAVLFHLAQLLLALAAFLPALLLLSGAQLRATAWLALPLLLLHALMAAGLAFLLSALTAAFRDVAHLTEMALLLSFWLTPVVYPAAMAPAPLRALFAWSPPAAFSMAYQDLLFFGRLPEPRVLATLLLAPPLALVVGHGVFRRRSPAFVEEM